MIAKAVESVQPQAVRKDVDITTLVEPPTCTVNGDEVTLVEALVNLLVNAIKYSHAGSQVEVISREQQDNIVISVTDTGIGIPKQELPYIFDGFFTGKNRPADEYSSGLGLPITRRIVQAHGGTITVASEPGRGSTFTITLPAVK